MDFLVTNLHKAEPDINLSRLLQECGYIVDQHPLTGAERYPHQSNSLVLEFLVRQMGSGSQSIMNVHSMHIKAQALRYLDFLLAWPLQLRYEDVVITTPRPQAYVLHKLLINSERNDNKKRKDMMAVKALMLVMLKNDEEYRTLLEILRSRPRKQQDRIIMTGQQNDVTMFRSKDDVI